MNMRRENDDGASVGEADNAYAELRAAFAACPVPGNPAERRRSMTEEEREAWQYLQKRTTVGSVADGDIACLLAHFRVDYARNIRRLLRCWMLGEGSAKCPRRRGTEALSDAGRQHIAGHAARLYHRRRDPDLLDWLLDSSPRGEAVKTARSQALLALWDAHWKLLLRAAAGNAVRCRSVSDALRHVLRGRSDSLLLIPYLRQLHLAVTGRDSVLRRAALTILMQLRQRRRHAPLRATRPRTAHPDVRNWPLPAVAPHPSSAGIEADERTTQSCRRLRRTTPCNYESLTTPRRTASGRTSPDNPAAQGE